MDIATKFWRNTGLMSGGLEMSSLSHGRWQKLNDAVLVSAIKMYGSGMSLVQIASRLNISRQSLWSSFKARSVLMRSQKRFGSENHFYRGGIKAIDSSQNKAEKALLRGKLQRSTKCERCGEIPPPFKDGRSAIQAHHPDYLKPLEVLWLCQKCHHKEHQNV